MQYVLCYFVFADDFNKQKPNGSSTETEEVQSFPSFKVLEAYNNE